MNFRVENIELINDRYYCHLPKSEIVYDSRQGRSDNYSSLKINNRMGQIPFLTTTERFIEKDEITTSSSESNCITINCKGNVIDMKTKLSMPKKLLQFSSGGGKGRLEAKSTRQQYSFGSNRLNKTLYEDDVEVLTIDKRLKLDRVGCPKWSTVSRDVEEYSNPNTGPGYYECYDTKEEGPSSIINDIPRFDENPKLDHRSDNRSEYSSLSELGSIKWNSVSRWNHPFYRKEPYVKTSGMKLDQDYDEFMDKRITFDFTKMSKRDFSPPKNLDHGSDISPDFGSMITMQTASLLSPVKYAASFKSKAPMGMKTIYATSGVNIGPGTLQLPPAIVVKEPDKISYYMLRGRSGMTEIPSLVADSPTGRAVRPKSTAAAQDYDNREELRIKIQEERTRHGKLTQCAL